jgi:tetratricopeptide (TPR) repeat protein
VASNLRDCAPFASIHATNLGPAAATEFAALSNTAATNAAAGRVEEALSNYQRAQALDPTFAELQFRLGQCLLQRSNHVEAKNAFVLARDRDALPFRADSKVNGLIREAAGRNGAKVRLATPDDVLAERAADGVPGAEFFFEHVHLSFAGNYQLALTLARAIEPQLPSSITQRQGLAWASEQTCEHRLGLTDWNRVGVLGDVLRRIQGAPFNRQANHQAQVRHWQAELDGLRARLTPERVPEARAIYREALLRAPRDPRLYEGYAEFLEATGNLEEAAAQWEAVLGLLPHHFVAYVHAGRLLGRQRQWSSAEARLRAALALEPRSGEAHLELARVLAGRGELEAALAEFSEAQRWQPANALIYYHLADLLAKQDKREAARDALARAVQLQPSFWEARYLLGVELAMADRILEAQQQFEEVLRWRPDHARAHLNLGVALARQGKRHEARPHFEETLRLDPENAKARRFLEAVSSDSSPPL